MGQNFIEHACLKPFIILTDVLKHTFINFLKTFHGADFKSRFSVMYSLVN